MLTDGVLAAEDCFSPVNKSLVKASTSNGGLLLGIDGFRVIPVTSSSFSSRYLRSAEATFFWNGLEGMPSVLWALGGTFCEFGGN